MKIRTVGVELSHADWKDMTKLTVAFSSYANAPNTLTLGFGFSVPLQLRVLQLLVWRKKIEL